MVTPIQDAILIEKAIEEGGYESDEVKTFWVENEDEEKVGIVKIYDLQDEIPFFDLRIADMSRGYGYGPKALRLVAEYVFGLPGRKSDLKVIRGKIILRCEKHLNVQVL